MTAGNSKTSVALQYIMSFPNELFELRKAFTPAEYFSYSGLKRTSVSGLDTNRMSGFERKNASPSSFCWAGSATAEKDSNKR